MYIIQLLNVNCTSGLWNFQVPRKKHQGRDPSVLGCSYNPVCVCVLVLVWEGTESVRTSIFMYVFVVYSLCVSVKDTGKQLKGWVVTSCATVCKQAQGVAQEPNYTHFLEATQTQKRPVVTAALTIKPCWSGWLRLASLIHSLIHFTPDYIYSYVNDCLSWKIWHCQLFMENKM